MEQQLLIRNALILTFGELCRIHDGWDMLITGDRIAEIQPRGQIRGYFENTIDARGRVVMPGLINAHTHFYSAFARGLATTQPAADFLGVLSNLWWRLDHALSQEDILLGTQITLLESIRNGCTTLIDHHSSPGIIPGSLDAIATAVKSLGLRACLCFEISDRNGEASLEQGMEENRRFIAQCSKEDHSQIKALIGLHAPFTLSDRSMERAAELGKSLNTGFHLHVSEGEEDVSICMGKYGKRPMARLHAAGLLGENTLAAHCVHVNQEDMELLSATGTQAIHNPQSNLNNAVGIADLAGLLRHGVKVGLGTDAMSTNMLEEARAALWCHHLRQGNPSGGLFDVASALTTANPAIASRIWGFRLGELKKGAAADILITNYQPSTPLNEGNVYGHLIHGIGQTSIDTTICAGKVLMRQGQFQEDLNTEQLFVRARQAAAALWKRM